jgi:hypothetical protein
MCDNPHSSNCSGFVFSDLKFANSTSSPPPTQQSPKSAPCGDSPRYTTVTLESLTALPASGGGRAHQQPMELPAAGPKCKKGKRRNPDPGSARRGGGKKRNLTASLALRGALTAACGDKDGLNVYAKGVGSCANKGKCVETAFL